MSSSRFPATIFSGNTDFTQRYLLAQAKSLFAKQYVAYTPNSEWPTLTIPATTTQQVQMLVAIPPTGHRIAVICAGAYTVDWGDSTTENVATGIQANHTYTYASISSSATSMGYKVAIITITPQAGQNLTSFNCYVRNATTWKNLAGTNIALTNPNDSRILDIVISMPYGTSLTIGSYLTNILHNSLERVRITSSAITSTSNLFYNCYGLQDYAINSSANITSTDSMFYNCISLTYGKWFNTQYVTNALSMFYGCTKLLSTANFNFDSATNLTSLFYNCRSLLYIPFSSFSAATSLQAIFQNCFSLLVSPNFYMPNVANATYMYYGCGSLTYIPTLQMPKVTNMNNFMFNAYSLPVVPNFYAPLVTNMSLAYANMYALHTVNHVPPASVTTYSQCFANDSSLVSVPTFDCTNVTTLAYMFQSCPSIKNITLTNTGNVTNWNTTFSGCTSLETVGTITVTKNADFTTTFNSCNKLSSITWGSTDYAPYVACATNYNWYPRGIVLHPNGVDMYIMHSTSYIMHMRWNASTGKFVLCEQKTNTAGNQYWGVVTPDGNYLFATNNASNLYAMPISATSGSLGATTAYTIGNGSRISISPDGTKLFTTSASGGIIYYFTRTSAGIETSGSLTTSLAMPDNDVSKDNLFLYVVTGTTNTLVTYSINQTTGAPTYVATTSGLNNGIYVTVSPDNLHVYVSNFSGNNILVYTRNTVTGTLTLSQTFTLAAGSPYKIVFSSDGKFGYVTNYSSSTFTVMSRDTVTGNLTSLGFYYTRANPTGIAISADNSYLHISCGTGGVADGLVSIPLNTTTGLPTKVPAPVFTYSSTFNGCNNLKSLPALDFSSSNNGVAPIDSTLYSLETISAKSALHTVALNGLNLSSDGLNTYFLGLQRPFGPGLPALACTNNPGYNGRQKTGSTWTTSSLSITTSSTSDIAVGDVIWGTFNHAVNAAWTFNSGTNTVSHTGNTRINGTQIAFYNLTNAAGVSLYFPYYIVNATGTTFQLAYTAGGTPITFDSGSSTSAYFEVKVTEITSGTTFTVDNYPMIAGSNATLNVASARITYAFMNGWTVS